MKPPVGCLAALIWPVLSSALLVSTALATGAENQESQSKPAASVSYYRQIRPILQANCQGCHQPARPQGGYVMTSHADLLKSGDRGQPGVVPGQPDKSVLIEQIVPKKDKAASNPRLGKVIHFFPLRSTSIANTEGGPGCCQASGR